MLEPYDPDLDWNTPVPHPAKAKLAQAAAPRQLDLGLEEPVQPACKLGDQVRVIKLGYRRVWPGGPISNEAQVTDGKLVGILQAGHSPPEEMIRRKWFSAGSRKSKYDRWIVHQLPGPRVRYQRHVVLTMDKHTRGFRYDLAE